MSPFRPKVHNMIHYTFRILVYSWLHQIMHDIHNAQVQLRPRYPTHPEVHGPPIMYHRSRILIWVRQDPPMCQD